MRKRRKAAVLRYHKVNKDNQFEKWMLHELMLYTPFRGNDLEDFENRTSVLYMERNEWINKVKSKVMEHLESVEEARYMVEQSTKEFNIDDIGYELNANYEQEQADSYMEGLSNHPDYLHLDTDGLTPYDGAQKHSSLFKDIDIPDLKELRRQTRKLDEFQMEILNLAIMYAKDVVKSRREGNPAAKPIYLIGHGGAGAGKSTVINLVSKWCHYILKKEGDDVDRPYIIKTAFTGTAASRKEMKSIHYLKT